MTQNSKEEKPHYLGHRSRLREQFLADRGRTMPDYKLLELLLTYSIPRRDVSPLAKNLLKEFGNLTNIFGADYQVLEDLGLTRNTLALLGAILELGRRVSYQKLHETDCPIFQTYDCVIDYCRSAMAHLAIEEFRIIFLGSGLRFIREKLMQRGTVNEVFIHPREVVKETLDCNAAGIVLVHNHPGGHCKPSQQDKKITQEIVEALDCLKITVHDHIIITPDSYFSFRESGLLPE